MTKASPYLKTITIHVKSKQGNKTTSQFLDEWLKDKSSQNARRIKEVIKALEGLEGLKITLPTE